MSCFCWFKTNPTTKPPIWGPCLMVFLFWLIQNKSSNSALWGDLKNRYTHVLPTRHGLGHFVGKVGARRCFLYAHGAIYVGAVRVRAGHLRDSLSWRLAWNPKKPSLADSMFVCRGSKAQDAFRTSWFFVSLCCETQTGGPFSSARSHVRDQTANDLGRNLGGGSF